MEAQLRRGPLSTNRSKHSFDKSWAYDSRMESKPLDRLIRDRRRGRPQAAAAGISDSFLENMCAFSFSSTQVNVTQKARPKEGRRGALAAEYSK